MSNGYLTTHVLDIYNGTPGKGIKGSLFIVENANKKKMKVGVYPIEDSKWLDIGQWSEYRKSLKFD